MAKQLGTEVVDTTPVAVRGRVAARWWPPASSRAWVLGLPELAVFGIIGVLYGASAELAWSTFEGLAFFPPAGLTMAAVLLSPRPRWAVVAAAVMIAETTVDVVHQVPLRFALGYGLANTVEPLLGAFVFQWLRPRSMDLAKRGDALAFLLACCVIGPGVGGMVGAAFRVVEGHGGHWLLWTAQWWAGDGVAILVVTSSLLLVRATWRDRRWWLEVALGMPAVVGLSLLAMATSVPTALFVLPIFASAAVRLGPAGVAVFGAVFAFIANYYTGLGHGPFADLGMSHDSRLAWLQVFIAVNMVISWFFAIEVRERLAAVRTGEFLRRERDQTVSVMQVLQRAVQPQAMHGFERLELGAAYHPASPSLGGDWYDAITLPDGRVLISLGDVVGHGVLAIEDMTQLRYASRALAIEGRGPALLLHDLSQLTATATRGGYATVLIGRYDPATGETTLASAGHPPPVLRRADTGRAEVVRCATGPPLGAVLHVAYEETTLVLAPGDLLVLYSDGLVERRGRVLDEGIEQLVAIVQGAEAGDLDELCNRVAAGCHPDTEAFDDVCVLVARRPLD